MVGIPFIVDCSIVGISSILGAFAAYRAVIVARRKDVGSDTKMGYLRALVLLSIILVPLILLAPRGPVRGPWQVFLICSVTAASMIVWIVLRFVKNLTVAKYAAASLTHFVPRDINRVFHYAFVTFVTAHILTAIGILVTNENRYGVIARATSLLIIIFLGPYTIYILHKLSEHLQDHASVMFMKFEQLHFDHPRENDSNDHDSRKAEKKYGHSDAHLSSQVYNDLKLPSSVTARQSYVGSVDSNIHKSGKEDQNTPTLSHSNWPAGNKIDTKVEKVQPRDVQSGHGENSMHTRTSQKVLDLRNRIRKFMIVLGFLFLVALCFLILDTMSVINDERAYDEVLRDENPKSGFLGRPFFYLQELFYFFFYLFFLWHAGGPYTCCRHKERDSTTKKTSQFSRNSRQP